MLLSGIEADEDYKFSIAESVLNSLKAYINPEFYMSEKGIGDHAVEKTPQNKDESSETPESFKNRIVVNQAFDQQSAIGRSTGYAKSPKVVRDAIEKAKIIRKKEEETGLQKGHYDLTGMSLEDIEKMFDEEANTPLPAVRIVQKDPDEDGYIG